MTVQIENTQMVLSPDDIHALVSQVVAELTKSTAVESEIPEHPQLFAVPQAHMPPDFDDTLPALGRGPLLGAAAKLEIRWSAGGYAWISKEDATAEQAEEYWRSNREALEASCNWASKFTNTALMNRAPVAAAHLRFSRINGRESAEAFLKPIGTLVGLQEDTGQHTLVRKLQDHVAAVAKGKTKKKLENEDILVVLTRLYVKHLRGKSVSKIGWPKDWITPPIPRV